MNRFKYRAWHKNSMIYNVAIINGCLAIEEDPDLTEPTILLEDAKGYRQRFYSVWAKYKTYSKSTVMQWTGMTDINGADLYDEDIVKIWHDDEPSEFSIGKIIWNLGREYPAFDIYLPNPKWAIGWEAYSDEYNSFSCPDHSIEKIGNYFENPELLKKEKS